MLNGRLKATASLPFSVKNTGYGLDRFRGSELWSIRFSPYDPQRFIGFHFSGINCQTKNDTVVKNNTAKVGIVVGSYITEEMQKIDSSTLVDNGRTYLVIFSVMILLFGVSLGFWLGSRRKHTQK